MNGALPRRCLLALAVAITGLAPATGAGAAGGARVAGADCVLTVEHLPEYLSLDYTHEPPLGWTYFRIVVATPAGVPCRGVDIAVRSGGGDDSVRLDPAGALTTDAAGTAYVQVRFDRELGPPQIVASMRVRQPPDGERLVEARAAAAQWNPAVLARDLTLFDREYMARRLADFARKAAATQAAAEEARMAYDTAWWRCYKQKSQGQCRREIAALEGPKQALAEAAALQRAAGATAEQIAASLSAAAPLLQHGQLEMLALPGFERAKLTAITRLVQYLGSEPAASSPGFWPAVGEALGIGVIQEGGEVLLGGLVQVTILASPADGGELQPGDLAVAGTLARLSPDGRGELATPIELVVRGDRLLVGGRPTPIHDVVRAVPAAWARGSSAGG